MVTSKFAIEHQFFLKIDIFAMKSFCSILLSCHSSLCRLVAPSPHTTRIKSGSLNSSGTLLVIEVISSLSLVDESNASSSIRDLNCDLNGLNTAKVIRDTNSKPQNSEIYIVVCVATLTIVRVTTQTTIAPLAPTIAVGLTLLSSWCLLNW